jgi:hypothetical protein
MANPKDQTTPPDTDKEEEGLEEGLIDDTSDVPDMGEGEVVEEEVTEEGEPTPTPDKDKLEEGEASEKLQEFMKKKGLKSLDEVATVLSESEKRTTQLEQERRLSSLLPQNIPPRPKTQRQVKEIPKLTEDPVDMSKEDLEKYLRERDAAVEDRLTAKYEDAEADKEYNKAYAQASRLINKDPEKFERLKPIMANLHGQYENATFEQLYDAADGLEEQVEKERKASLSRDLGLNQGDLDNLKALVGKARPAKISGATSAGGEGMTERGKKSIKKLKDDIFGPQSSVIRD